MNEYFYYLYLADALTDLGFSKAGIDQLVATQPLTSEKDRQLLPNAIYMFARFYDRRKHPELLGSYMEWIPVLTEIGFTALGLNQIQKSEVITSPDDRALLLGTLRGFFERNEDNLPRGYRGNMKQQFKNAEMRKHGEI